jgi:hypothetical protein
MWFSIHYTLNKTGDSGMRRLIALTVSVLVLQTLALPVPAADENEEQVLRAAGIPTDGPALKTFFRNRTIDGADNARLEALVRQLGDDSFLVREQASRKLVAIGPRAREALVAARKDPDPEIAHRAEECLRQIKEAASTTVLVAAVRVLARHQPAGAAEVLIGYLPYAEDEIIADEVRSALVLLALRDGKAEPALLAALEDGSAARRGAAGMALARRGVKDHAGVRKLLDDPDLRVRLRVGMALTLAKDKDAMPALLRLLDQLPLEETGVLEDLLYRLAADKAPTVAAGTDPGARRKFREAWEAWWKENQIGIDPERLAKLSQPAGCTLVVLLDAGKVLDLDPLNRENWRVEGLDFPLDVQLLPGEEHILAAEHHANRVTERDRKGKVVWEYKVAGPLVAQRLPNGNTFIATQERVFEVDKDNKELYSYSRPAGDFFMKVQKLRNGDIACVTRLGGSRYVRLTPDGTDFREVKSFGVELMTSGGRIDVLPNGHVIVPERDSNRVAEYDANGRLVHEVAIEQPVAAVRLPNGNTLVTSFTQLRAVELTRDGKEVWQYKADTKVTRAFRR